MIREVIMPQLGMGMSEGTIAEWNAKEGERVSREQPLVSVETEKVVTGLPSPYAGYVHIVVATGATVPTETLIAQIADTEAEYLQQLAREMKPVVVHLCSGEVLRGSIEYYDQRFIRLTREGAPNLFIFKHDIKYFYEE